MPSSLQGGGGVFGDLAIFGRFGVKNHPKKKFPNVFGDTLGGYLRCFRMVLTRFGLSRPQFGSLIPLREASRCLVACKGGFGDLAVFGGFGLKNHPKKKFPNAFGDTLGGYL